MRNSSKQSGYLSDLALSDSTDQGYYWQEGPRYIPPVPAGGIPVNTLTGNEILVDGKFVSPPAMATIASSKTLILMAVLAVGYGAYKLYNRK